VRLVTGAVQIAAVRPVAEQDPCLTPFSTGGLTWKPSESRSIPMRSVTADASGKRSSWWPIDLTPILTGEQTGTPPSILRRQDGAALFYLGRVNGLIGASESGKSWVALLAVSQELDDGNHVVYVDFEDTPKGVVGRLLKLGIKAEILAERFHYIGPAEAPMPDQFADLQAALAEHRPRLVVMDGVNAAMSLAGLELISNTDATKFFQFLLMPIVAEDRAIVYIDHTPKSKEDESLGGIGAQAKRAMTSGCAIRVDKKGDFGPGVTGYLKLTVDKDREGMVREIATGARMVGTAIISSDPESTTIIIEVPESSTTEGGKFRPTFLMERVSAYLASAPLASDTSKNAIVKAVRGNDRAIFEALDRLVEDGNVERVGGPRGASYHRLIRPFSELAPLTSATSARPLPTSAQAEVISDKPTSASPAKDDPLRGSVGGQRSGVNDEGTSALENDPADNSNENNLTWRHGNLVNRRTGEVVRRRI